MTDKVRESSVTVAAFLGAGLLASACAGTRWHNEDALAAESIEMQVDGAGRAVEIEYHVDPMQVPAEVRKAMDELHPGGGFAGAEKEWHGSDCFWELTKEIDGRAVEAMFRPDGSLHSEEVQVASEDVPEAVRSAARARVSGEFTSWEEIRDGDRRLVAYHAKAERDGARYKLILTPEGAVERVVREMPAEIEIPTR